MVRKYLFLSIFLFAGCPGPGSVDKDKSDRRVALAGEALRAQNLEVAEREAGAALGFNPRNEQAHNLLGIADQMRANQAGLLIDFSDCLTGLDAEVIQKERDQALLAADAHFVTATELVPTYGEAWANRGLIAMQIEDFEAATTYFRRAIEHRERLQPKTLGATRARLGMVQFELGDFPQAAKELRQALQFDPELCIALYGLGRVYFARQEWNNALERFRKVNALPKCNMQEAYLYLSKTEAALGLSAEAAKTAASCQSLAPKSCVARECRGEPNPRRQAQ